MYVIPKELNFDIFGGELIGFIYNPNTATAVFSSIAIQGNRDFSITSALSNCGSSLDRGGLCAVSIEYDPFKGGWGPGQVVFHDNASNSPQVIILHGEGEGHDEWPLLQRKKR